ncbi:zinc metallopeptidase RseP [Escherichia coli]|nr:zinc metallopeptidase RseP [Escherichia coli]VDG58561.1 zinc metallopeptidase RseP [Escherichia coli]VDG58565.1 zinc metallopeptidase RseP [Escherichia coli]VDG58569.1 zinc metallopeptidase RseP [Escherichia coli]VDG58573.1 zinc metallopeptidase RseP [Escherichia coli]
MFIVAVLMLAFLIFVHELGHFTIARICGVKVEVFSIGFGKKLCFFKLGVIMVIAVSCVKLLSAHNSTQHTSRKHKV